MSLSLDGKLADVAQWWDFNKRTAMPVEQEVKFLRKLNENLFDLLTFIANDIRELEGRPSRDRGNPLYVPSTMASQGDMRRFG